MLWDHEDRSMPNFGFHIRHENHSSNHNVDLSPTGALPMKKQR
jgi:hypothetical protein